MSRENSGHITKIIGLILGASFVSLLFVFFLAVSAEEDGLVRDIMLKIPIIRDLVPNSMEDPDDIVDRVELEPIDTKQLDIEGVDELKTEEVKDREVEQEPIIDLDKDKDVSSKEQKVEFLSNNELTRKGEELFINLRLKEAKDIFLTTNEIDPVANYYLALLSAYERDGSSVRAYIKKVNDLNGSELLQIRGKEIIKAFDEFNLYSGSTEDHLDALVGRAYLNVGQVSLAIIKLKESIKINNSYKDAYVLLGAAYMMNSDYKEAENYLTQALPTDRPEPNFYLGLARFNQSKYQEAILAFREASDLGYHPEIDLRKKLGESLMAISKYEEALVEFNRVIEINPLDPKGYYEAIWLSLKGLNSVEKGLYYAELALNTNTSSPLAHDYMGWVYLEAGKYDMAKKYLDAALSYDSNLASANYHMGDYYVAQSDIESAKLYYQRAVDSSPESRYGVKASQELQKF